MEKSKIIGKVTGIQIYNNWGRASLIDATGKLHSINGEAVTNMENGKTYECTGRIKKHPTYGPQFEIDFASAYVECIPTAIAKYLIRHFKGIGEKTAEKIILDYQQRNELELLRDQLLTNPYQIDFAAYTKRPIAVQLRSGFENFISNNLFMHFGGIKTLNARHFKMLAKWLTAVLSERYEGDLSKSNAPVDEAFAYFMDNPYRAIQYVEFYGFAAADAIGLNLGFPRSDIRRLSALAAHVLVEGCQHGGHVYLTGKAFAEALAKFDSTVKAADAVRAALADGLDIVHIKAATSEGLENRYYPTSLYNTELLLASALATRMSHAETGNIRPIWQGSPEELEQTLHQTEKKLGMQLDKFQFRALTDIFLSPTTLHTLTAGPGCGKTALMEFLADIMRHEKIIRFCAPTGKAAKVLNSRIHKYGLTATTIHSMLGVQGNNKFIHKADNPLPCDVLITDESGMNDLQLSYALISACKDTCHIIFLGDTDQLPSVGSGAVLRDMLNLPIDHHRLSVTHRNDGGILAVVKQIREGKVDLQDKNDVSFHRLPEADAEQVDKVVQIYTEAYEKSGSLAKIGLLVARRKGSVSEAGWNVTYLNEVLRGQFNANGMKIKGTNYKVGDRIIIRKNARFNDYDPNKPEEEQEEGNVIQVVNGDTGTIQDFIVESDNPNKLAYLLLKLDDDRLIYYPADNLSEIGLAYAITVHASQGSEYDYVIYLNVNGAPNFIHRGIPFTACSRAKKHLHIFTEPEVWYSVIKRPIPHRNSNLVEQTTNLKANGDWILGSIQTN